ncbi:MAG: type II toxin-antitoxin system death-on-curing family toxin [Alsobacter sp.]
MTEPLWLDSRLIVDIHAEQLALFGGPSGLREPGLLDSALVRPVNKWNYGETDLPALAAAYAFGLAKNHPFVDGNKRIAFLAMMLFLRLNGILFQPPPLMATAIMIEVAAGAVSEDGLARWIRDQWPHP